MRHRRRRLALVDLDGVVADDRHRCHHAIARDWRSYFDKMVHDAVWRQGRELYENCFITDWEVMFLTGRREAYRDATGRWLAEHGFDSTVPVLMRPDSSSSRLAEFKSAVIMGLRRDWDDVIMFDDDPAVIEAVRRIPGVLGRHCTWYTKPDAMVKRART